MAETAGSRCRRASMSSRSRLARTRAHRSSWCDTSRGSLRDDCHNTPDRKPSMILVELHTIARVVAVVALLAGSSALEAQTITGSVSSPSGAVAGATVRLLELERVVRTGASGHFTFGDVPNGTYRVFT